MLARKLGYRNWHELEVSTRVSAAPVPRHMPNEDALHFVLGISDALGLPDADVQYVISKSRLVRNSPWSMDDQLSIRSAIWRQRLFGPPKRGKPGTVVRDRAHGANTPAYLKQAGRPTHVLFDTGLGIRADFEVVTPRTALADFVPSRLWLPYGYWTLKDGSEVIFARDYLPMWRIAEGVVERLTPWLWINGIIDEFFFAEAAATVAWARGSARQLALNHLSKHRIFELPKLVDVMPHLFEADVETVGDSVSRLQQASGVGHVPPYAQLNTLLALD
ncbi:hypothetical protein [Reyranella massiliensis]|uniref:hypothetical protein n=1 Tax=Reyranella massiliensis TaxID=445220 RepID=UPI001FE088FC|nr:hypothetical protein [Reyranella massiliensis]